MDLALSLGCSIADLEAQTDERAFGLWARYDSERVLPWRRIEMHLAQITMTLLRVNGAKNVTLDDFLFKARKAAEPLKTFGFKPRPKRRKD